MNEEIIIIGHKNPDLDSIASAIALSEYKKIKGQNGIAARAGEIDKETEYILKKFHFAIPKLITDLTNKKVCIVDHSSFSQMVNNGVGFEIIEVIDHHNISDIKTGKPIRYHCEAVGSTCSIIASYFLAEGLKISKNLAGLMLAAMISDTDLFKSPTTTDFDLNIKTKLEKISEINSEELGKKMFKIKSNIANKSTMNLINEDLKEYNFGKIKSQISQVKLMDTTEFLETRNKEILNEMNKKLKEENLNLIIFIVTDLIKEGSDVFVVGNTSFFENKMNIKLKNNRCFIKNLLSRKKQVIPFLLK